MANALEQELDDLEKKTKELREENRNKRSSILSRIKERDDFLIQLQENRFKISKDNPHTKLERGGWDIVHPRFYIPGKMEYTNEEQVGFIRSVDAANEKLFGFMNRLVDGLKELVLKDEESLFEWKPIGIGWNTFALANFLNSPKMGLVASFDRSGLYGSGSLTFDMLHTDRGVEPFFYGNWGVYGKPESKLWPIIETIQKDIQESNHPQFRYFSRTYQYQGSFSGVIHKDELHRYLC